MIENPGQNPGQVGLKHPGMLTRPDLRVMPNYLNKRAAVVDFSQMAFFLCIPDEPCLGHVPNCL